MATLTTHSHYIRVNSSPSLPDTLPDPPPLLPPTVSVGTNTVDPFSSLLVISNPDSSLAVASLPEHEQYVIGKDNLYDNNARLLPLDEDNNMGDQPLVLLEGNDSSNSPRVYVRLGRYYSNPMRTRRRKFLISLLLSDILYCLLLLSATHEFSLITVLLIAIVLIDLLGIGGASRDSLPVLTTFIVFSSASVIAQSIMAFSPLFILRILVVLMAFRVRGELMLQAQLFPS